MSENKEISPEQKASIVIKHLEVVFDRKNGYTPMEIQEIANSILAQIPPDYTVEEIKQYEKDYLKAMDDLKKEFSQKKNLWDNFLDILAGGTHQTASERVMLNRWIEGEKGKLE